MNAIIINNQVHITVPDNCKIPKDNCEQCSLNNICCEGSNEDQICSYLFETEYHFELISNEEFKNLIKK